LSDPVGKNLIGGWGANAGAHDCDGIGWCFDPAIFFDDDGSGYFTFGGGSSTSRPAAEGNNNIFDMVKFNSDMKGYDWGTKVELKIGGPKAMEASYIHKNGSTYYLSYSTTDLRIAYGTSNKVTGPYTYQGIFMDNPNINGKNINANNNNHHGIAQFKGKWYVVYHDRRLVQAAEHPASLGVADPAPAYHRSVSIDEFTYNGTAMNKLTYTDEGPKQIENFDPYRTYPAITSSKQRNIRSRTDWESGKAVKHVLTPLSTKESWIRVSGVDFGGGATNFLVTAASVASGNKIEIRTGSPSGTLAGSCELKQTSGWKTYEANECAVDGLKGVVDQLFLVFKGSKDSTMGILEWEFSGAPSEPQTPYSGTAIKLPAVIQAEEFDKGGARKGYSDADSENQGDANFRTDEGVDIVLGGTGKAIGYTSVGEWLEYTVNVSKAGDYPIKASASTGSESTSFCLLLDGKTLMGDTIKVSKTGEDWSVYQKFDGGNVYLDTGLHEIRLLITGDNVNVDWFSLGDVPDSITAINSSLKYNAISSLDYKVFNLNGKMVGSVSLKDMNASQALKKAGFKSGVYMLRNASNKKSFMISTEK